MPLVKNQAAAKILAKTNTGGEPKKENSNSSKSYTNNIKQI